MAKNAATEDLLGTLHGKVATVMVGILTSTEVALEAYAEAAESASAEEIAVMTKPELSPAMLSAMTKFLSDNKITCNVEDAAAMSDLEEIIRKKRARKSIGNVVALHPEED